MFFLFLWMMNRSQLFLPALLLLFIAASCRVSDGTKEALALSRCEFRVASVENIRLAGMDIGNATSLQNLEMADIARLMSLLGEPSLMLTMQVNLQGRNPNATAAGISRLDYILFIDDVEITSGVLDKPVTLPAGGMASIPVDLRIDLKKLLQGKSLDAVLNFAFNLSGNGNRPSRISAKLKPSISTGKKTITYPGYITVRAEFSGK
jgi:LEA14-like dessication related protein